MQSDVVIKLDDFDLTEYMDLTESPDLGLLPQITNETKAKKIVDSTFSDKVYPFSFLLSNRKWLEYRDVLIGNLPFMQTKKLTISILPNRYWNVVVDGDSTFTRRMDSSEDVEITLSFLIPDATAHASTLSSATARVDSQGILSMDIDYEGTIDTPLNLKIVNNDGTGYLAALGAAEDESTFLTQLGYVDEAEGETRTKMSTIFAKDGGNFSKWTDASTFYENTTKKIVSSMNTTSSYGGWLGGIPATATNDEGRYYGAAKELVMPTAVQNVYLWARAWFETGKMGQTGMWTLAFIDEDNNHLCSMHIYKTDKVGNSAKVNFHVPDGKGGTAVFKEIKFTPSYWIPPNPYGNQSRLKNRNMFDLRKEGGKITFFWYGQYYSVNVPSIASKKVKRIQFFTGQFAGRTTSQLVTRMGIRDVLVIDLKSQYWQELPNRFGAGTTVETRKDDGMNMIYRDGIATLEDIVTGSTFPVLKPGRNRIEFYYSDFTTVPPTITATYEKRWY